MTSAQFFALLRRRTRRNAVRVDRSIERATQRELVILMADSSGFSRKTHEHGILQFLAVMTQCYDRLIPLVERRDGTVISHAADNILAVFEDPEQAVDAALACHRWLRARNRGRPSAERFNICIGIHAGTVVRLSDNVYGGPVNVAAKLGEDLAGKDETLVTAEVARRVEARFRCTYSRSVEIGGRIFEIHRVRRARTKA
jgi:class 3 adenylate cyclase